MSIYFIRVIQICLIALLLLTGNLLPAKQDFRQQKHVNTNLEIPAGQWRGIRMRGLVLDAQLRIKVTSDGPITFGIYQKEAFQQLPDAQALVGGKTANTLEITTRIPAKDDYYLLLDNRAGDSSRNVTIDLLAESGTVSSEPARLLSTSVPFEQVKSAILKTFKLDALEISFVSCSSANAYAAPSHIFICTEYIRELHEAVDGDNTRLSDITLYTIMHELGHILFKLWAVHDYRNEKLIDEFAVVLMIMFNQTQRLDTVASYFEEKKAWGATSNTSPANNHHSSSNERARNIRLWLGDDDLARRWQRVTIPHMRTRVLQDLLRHPRSWSDSKRTSMELLKRREK